jgi:hypothetical protein
VSLYSRYLVHGVTARHLKIAYSYMYRTSIRVIETLDNVYLPCGTRCVKKLTNTELIFIRSLLYRHCVQKRGQIYLSFQYTEKVDSKKGHLTGIKRRKKAWENTQMALKCTIQN